MGLSRLRGVFEGPAGVRRAALTVLLTAALVYVNGLENDFLMDDKFIAFSNTELPVGAGPFRIFLRGEKFQAGDLPYYRPLTNLTYYVDRRIWGANPAGFHLTNLLLHGGNSGLVFWLARSLTGGLGTPLLTGLLFAVHPVHTESVTMVQGRTDLLMTLFLLLSFWLLRAADTGWARSRLAAGLSLGAFFLALLAKEMAVTWPVLLAGWCLLLPANGPDVARRRWRLLGLLGLVIGVYGALRLALVGLPHIDPGLVGIRHHSVRLLLIPRTLLTYLRLMVWPVDLHFYYEFPVPRSAADPAFLLPLVGLGAFLLGVAWLVRRQPLAIFGAAWFLVGLLPVSNIIPIPGFVLAERYLYFPSIGFLLAAAFLTHHLLAGMEARARRLSGAGVAAVLLLLAGFSVGRNDQWKDPLGVYEAMAASSPNSVFVRTNLALEYLDRGRVDDAIAQLERARALNPRYPPIYNDLGVAYARKGLAAEAEANYRRALALSPTYAEAHNNLGVLFEDRGQWAQAEAEYLQALRLWPRWRRPVANLANLYEKLGRTPEAARVRRLLEKVPWDPLAP